MAVITISRQWGSGGSALARKLAQTLGYRLIDKVELVERAQKHGVLPNVFEHVDEQTPSFPKRQYEEKYIVTMNEIIRNLAQEDNAVIVGRASEIILKEFPGVFHIRVVAPLDLRIRRVMERYDISHNEAAKAIARSDKNRSEYVRTFYHADIDDPLLYDLILNTNKLDIDQMVSYLVDVIKHTFKQ